MLQVEDVFCVGKLGAWPAASPTSVLEEDPYSDLMAEWASTWEASTPPSSSVSQPVLSPIRGSPLRSPSNSEPAMPPQQSTEAPKRTTRSLVETLHECLTSLPQASAIMADQERSTSDPTGATTTSALRQSSSRPPGKRRPRASRRTPTTIFETDPSEFRDMVQKLTGIPTATPGGAAPVRPRPQRASSALRPETLRSIRRLPPMGPPRPPPPLPSPLPPFLQHLQRSRTSEVINPAAKPARSFPGFARSCKREFDATEDQHSSSSALGSHTSYREPLMKRVMSAPTTSISSWWDQQRVSESQNMNISTSEQANITDTANAPFAMSSSSYSDSLAQEALLSSGPSPEFVRIDSADGQLAQEEQDFNFSQIESWLSADSMHS